MEKSYRTPPVQRSSFPSTLQAAFGWEDVHLFELSADGLGYFPSIGIRGSDNFWDEGTADKKAATVKLSHIFTEQGQACIPMISEPVGNTG